MNKTLKKGFILFAYAAALFSITTIDAYPYFFRRLLLFRGGRICRAVDLIGDVHIPEKVNRSRKLGPSEKALLEALFNLGSIQSDEKIELLGESDSRVALYPRNLFSRVIHGPFIRCLANTPGLWQILGQLQREFEIPKKQKLIYTHSDNYRLRLAKRDRKICASIPIQMIEKDLQAFEHAVDADTYAFVQNLWTPYKKILIEKNISWNGRGDAIHAYPKIMDFETIMKVLGSPHQHTIVLAGGYHCKNLETWLTQHCGFTTFIEEGEQYNFEDDNVPHVYTPYPKVTKESIKRYHEDYPILPPSTWEILGENPFSYVHKT